MSQELQAQLDNEAIRLQVQTAKVNRLKKELAIQRLAEQQKAEDAEFDSDVEISEEDQKRLDGLKYDVEITSYLDFTDRFCDYSLGYFSKKNSFRNLCLKLIFWPGLELFVTFIICVNLIFLIIEDTIDKTNPINRISQGINICIIVLFFLEMFIRVIARGLILAPHAFLRDVWGWVDLIICILGAISFVPVVPNLNALRGIKLVRTLAISSGWMEARVLAVGTGKSLFKLLQTAILFFFLYALFGIIATTMWKGTLRQNCFYVSENATNVTTLYYGSSIVYVPDDFVNFSYDDFIRYDSDRLCGGIECPNDTICLLSGDTMNPNLGATSFDSTPWAFFTLVNLMSQDGWSQTMYWTQDASSSWVWIYFVGFQFVVPFFGVNLLVAVISAEIAGAYEEAEIQQGRIARLKKSLLAEIKQSRKKPPPIPKRRPWDFISNRIQAYWVPYVQIPCKKLIDWKYFEDIVLFVIIMNGAALSTAYAFMPAGLALALEILNYLFIAAFTLECAIKMCALGVTGYFTSHWRKFDFTIVVASWVELIIKKTVGINVFFITFRSFRLLRILPRLAQKFVTVDLLVRVTLSSFRSVVALMMFLWIFLVVFVIIAKSTMGPHTPDDYPISRWNYKTFWDGTLTLYSVMCADGWTDITYQSMEDVNSYISIFYIWIFFVGQYVYNSMWIGILLNRFAIEEAEQIVAIDKLGNRVLMRPNQESDDDSSTGSDESPVAASPFADTEVDTLPSYNPNLGRKVGSLPNTKVVIINKETLQPKIKKTTNNFAMPPHSSMWIFGRTNRLRLFLFQVISHPVWEIAIALCIIANSIQLIIEHPLDTGAKYTAMRVLEIFFTCVYSVEMIMKHIIYGIVLHRGAYWRNGWLVIDGFSTIISIVGIIFPTAKMLQALRALRILRLFSKFIAMRITVAALSRAIPPILATCLFSLIIWLVFAIVGVQAFGGQLWYCNNPDVVNKSQCVGEFYSVDDGEFINATWMNPSFTFDNIGASLLTLFIVSTFSGWLDFMWPTIDIAGIDNQPIINNHPENGIFMFFFVMFGAFFCLNIIASAIVNEFVSAKSRLSGDLFLTPKQDRWLRAQRLLRQAKPKRVYDLPTNRVSRFLYPYVSSKYFVNFVMFIIVCNAIVLAIPWFDAPDSVNNACNILNIVFLAIFGVEAVLKIIALGPSLYFGPPPLKGRSFWTGYYHKPTWNKFDFVLVVVAVIGAALPDGNGNVINVFRLFRIFRLFRLIKIIKSLRVLFQILLETLPKLWTIILLMIITFYIYAIAGVRLFYDLYWDGELINFWANFTTFWVSLLTLFRMCTLDFWDGLMQAAFDPDWPCLSNATQTCGSTSYFIYFVTFVFIQAFIILNLFLSVLVDTFTELHDVEQSKSKIAEFGKFRRSWKHFDPKGSGSIRLEDVIPMLLMMDAPIGFSSDVVQNYVLGEIKKMELRYKVHNGVEEVSFEELLYCVTKRSMNINFTITDIGGTEETGPLAYDYFRQQQEDFLKLTFEATDEALLKVQQMQDDHPFLRLLVQNTVGVDSDVEQSSGMDHPDCPSYSSDFELEESGVTRSRLARRDLSDRAGDAPTLVRTEHSESSETTHRPKRNPFTLVGLSAPSLPTLQLSKKNDSVHKNVD